MDELIEAIEKLRKAMIGSDRLAYTTEELADALGTYPQRINLLRQKGALVGIKNGQGWIFDRAEAERFLKDFKGMDLSNEMMIEQAVRTVRIGSTKKALRQ